MARLNTQEIRAMEDGNPPAITPAEPEHAPESEEDEAEEKAKKAAEETEAKQLEKVLAHLDYEN